MELKEFIEKSVSDIIEATINLKRKYNKKNYKSDDVINEYNPVAPICNRHNSLTIDFDIAVTTSENGTAKAGSKIGISVLGANLNGEKGYNNENTSRIKFSIPFYPEYIDKNQNSGE